MGAFLLSIVHGIGSLVGFAATETARWVKQEAMRIARAARALGVWVLAHISARTALVAAMVLAWEAFVVGVSFALVPLADNVLHRLIPPGSAGDGFVWMLWDDGLSGREAFRLMVIYVGNYTLVWRFFSVWLTTSCISLATYRSALRSAKAVRDASL